MTWELQDLPRRFMSLLDFAGSSQDNQGVESGRELAQEIFVLPRIFRSEPRWWRTPIPESNHLSLEGG